MFVQGSNASHRTRCQWFSCFHKIKLRVPPIQHSLCFSCSCQWPLRQGLSKISPNEMFPVILIRYPLLHISNSLQSTSDTWALFGCRALATASKQRWMCSGLAGRVTWCFEQRWEEAGKVAIRGDTEGQNLVLLMRNHALGGKCCWRNTSH